jgi:hypothetical protein
MPGLISFWRVIGKDIFGEDNTCIEVRKQSHYVTTFIVAVYHRWKFSLQIPCG